MLDGIRCVAMPKIEYGAGPRLSKRTAHELEDYFKHTGIIIYIYISGQELKLINNKEKRPLTVKHIAEITAIGMRACRKM